MPHLKQLLIYCAESKSSIHFGRVTAFEIILSIFSKQSNALVYDIYHNLQAQEPTASETTFYWSLLQAVGNWEEPS